MKAALKIARLLIRIWTVAGETHLWLIAAGVAFFGMFAIFPGIAAIIAIFGLVADPTIVAEQLELVRDIIPEGVYDLFAAQITSVLATATGTLGFTSAVSLVLALWAARAGVAALMGGLNAIEGMPARNGIKQVFVALTLTVSLVTLAIVALIMVVILPLVLAFLPLAGTTVIVIEIVRWVLALGVLFGGLSLLYRFGPNMRPHRRPWFTVGAAMVVALWIGTSFGLTFYLANFGSYNEVYGSLGAVIGLLLWLYATAYLILLGAVLNAQIYGASPSQLPAQSPGADQPESPENLLKG